MSQIRPAILFARRRKNVFDRQRLIELIRRDALRFGEFTLASGKQASYYLDCRKVTLDSEGANVIAQGILEAIADDPPEAVGGMALGADPITAAVITCAGGSPDKLSARDGAANSVIVCWPR